MRYSILILGAGHAGGRTAQALRSQGFQGSIGLVGDERDLPYERPPLSKDFLLDRLEPAAFHLLPHTAWRELGIDLHLGRRAIGLDPAAHRVLFEHGGAAEYEKLVLATGARARQLSSLPSGPLDVHYLRSLEDARALKAAMVPGRRLAVLGAGLIGLEVAASACQLGLSVTVIEAAPRVLPRVLPPRLSAWVERLHRRAGVDLRLGCKVSGGETGRLELDDGTTVPADIIVAGIGAVANDELAVAAGLAVDDGVCIDDGFQTSDSDIYALGDVAKFTHHRFGRRIRLESWGNAEDQALRLATTLCGVPAAAAPVPWFWTDQHGRNVQFAGWPAAESAMVEFGDADSGWYLAYFLRGPALHGVIGIDCGREVRKAQALIAAGTPVDPSSLPTPRARVRSADLV